MSAKTKKLYHLPAMKTLLPFSLIVVLTVSCVAPRNSQPGGNSSELPKNTDKSTAEQAQMPTSNNSRGDEKEGEFNGYRYHFKKTENVTTALFTERFLPRDDQIFTGASRDVIKRSFGEGTEGPPTLSDYTTAQGISTKAVRFRGRRNAYLVLPVKEDTGEIHSLVITQVPLH